MPQLPQIVRERLKASPSPGVQPDADAHPDANELTAFAEKLLPESERALVLHHLARCSDCREVIALALPESEAAEVASTRTVRRAWFGWHSFRWGLVAAAIVAAASVGVLQFRERQRSNTLVAQVDSRAVRGGGPITTQAPQSRSAAPLALPQEETAAKSSSAIMQNQPGNDETKTLREFDRLGGANSAGASTIEASGAATQPKSKMAMAVPPRDLPFAPDPRKSMSPAMAKQQPAPALSKEIVPPPVSETVGVQSQSSQSEVQIAPQSAEHSLQARDAPEPQLPAERGDVVERAKPPVVPPAAPSAAPAFTLRWTISSSGSLQRSFDGGNNWQEVAVVANPEVVANLVTIEKAPRPQTNKSDKAGIAGDKKSQARGLSNPVFRAVAAAGLEVWVGGSGALLYHSTDGGEHWMRVQPSSDGVLLKGDITSVQFSDPQHGTISTAASEVWITNDGGQSWQTQ